MEEYKVILIRKEIPKEEIKRNNRLIITYAALSLGAFYSFAIFAIYTIHYFTKHDLIDLWFLITE